MAMVAGWLAGWKAEHSIDMDIPGNRGGAFSDDLG
jgi:hypothetical protein